MKKSSNVGGGAQGAAAMNGAAAKNAATDDMNVKEFYSLEFGRMRTMTDKNGEPFFCGKDVCDALGYKRAYDAIRQHVNHGDTGNAVLPKLSKINMAKVLRQRRWKCSSSTRAVSIPSSSVRNSKARSNSSIG